MFFYNFCGYFYFLFLLGNQHRSLKEKFESSLNDIQSQLSKHSEERLKQQSENDKLRENLEKLVQLEHVREEHFNHQLKTKQLEIQLGNKKKQ
jgi:hypothetical protein